MNNNETPKPLARKPLTDDEILAKIDFLGLYSSNPEKQKLLIDFARSIELDHGIKEMK